MTRTTTKPQKVLLASRNTVDRDEASLVGAEGAQQLIDILATRRSVNKLLLSHNKLSDAGCAKLFEYLGSEEGRKHPVKDISLHHNDIGDEGLRAIAGYLRGNTTLGSLPIHNNNFSLDEDTAREFATALNSSSLKSLYLSNNLSLTDASLTAFLPHLTTPHLRELQLSITSITALSGPTICQYILSPSFRLETFKLNGNNLGLGVLRDIVEAIKEGNHTLSQVELSANLVTQNEEEEKEGREKWKEVDTALKVVLKRNQLLKDQVGRDAVRLLRHSRPVLLRSSSSKTTTTEQSESESKPYTTASSDSLSPGLGLPMEIQLQILAYLSLSLSPSQRCSVYSFASTASTLPSLALPPLKATNGSKWDFAQCVPDPTALGAFPPVQQPDHGGCSGGKCMGVGNSISCRREGERMKWLEAVGCEFYDSTENPVPLQGF